MELNGIEQDVSEERQVDSGLYECGIRLAGKGRGEGPDVKTVGRTH